MKTIKSPNNYSIPKFQICIFSFVILTLISCQEIEEVSIFENPFQQIEELSINSDNCILEGRHLWVSNEIQTVNPDFEGIGGITKIYSPPLNLSPFQMGVRFFEKKVKTEYYNWKPGEIIQYSEINGIKIKCLIIPANSTKTVLVYELSNQQEEDIAVPIQIIAEPYMSNYDSLWIWAPRDAKSKAVLDPTPSENELLFKSDDGEIKISADNIDVEKKKNCIAGSVNIKPGLKKQFTVVVSYTSENHLNESNTQVRDQIREARERWNERLNQAYDNLGHIKSSNQELDLFYKRGILSLLSCEWNKNEFLLQPYFAESGIDGGAMCSYLWGYAYISKIMPIYNRQAWKNQIIQGIKTDAKSHYAFTPITGEGIGPWYSYNQYSAIRTIYDYVVISGDRAFLSEKINDKTVIDYCIEQALFKDDITKDVALVDYGSNHNLLELKKTDRYQYFVPSPNAERCWSYRAVDELCNWATVSSLNLSLRADALSKLISEELWSEDEQWFLTLDTLGQQHFFPTIQIFDMLRCNVLSKSQEQKILNHLNETEFLSQFGVHSLSKLDPAYDLNDADWGGPGVYAGDAPELIEDLYLSGHPDLAENVLSRILWWGKHFPYYPQAIIADDIDYRRNGRANIIAGITSPQSILFGLLGLEFAPNGDVFIKPNRTNLFHDFELRGLKIKDEKLDIYMKNNSISVKSKEAKVRKTEIGESIYLHKN